MGRTRLTDAAEARRALGALVAADESQLDLARAALLVACEEYADLDPQAYIGQLDDLGFAVRDRIRTEATPERQIAVVNALLFGEEGFRGNAANYYDPRNSYLNEVLDRRLGIPLTLALVYVEVGRRAQLPLNGVGFPAHFLVAYEAEPRVLIDPFTCGQIMSVDDCQRLLWESFGSSMRLEPAHLAASSKRQILTRLVTNLKVAYEHAGDVRRGLRASAQLAVVQPPAEAEAIRRHQALMRELRERRN